MKIPIIRTCPGKYAARLAGEREEPPEVQEDGPFTDDELREALEPLPPYAGNYSYNPAADRVTLLQSMLRWALSGWEEALEEARE